MIVACVIAGALILALVTAVALLRRHRDRLDYGDSCLDSWSTTAQWERRCAQSLQASRERRLRARR